MPDIISEFIALTKTLTKQFKSVNGINFKNSRLHGVWSPTGYRTIRTGTIRPKKSKTKIEKT